MHGSSRVGAGQAQGRPRAGTGQQLEPGRGRVGQERKWGRSTPGLGQEHSRSWQEQFKSRTGALYFYLLPVSAPMQYFMGGSRAGAGQEKGRIRAGAG